MPETLRAAVVQLHCTADAGANLDAADQFVRAAAADGAELVLLPEKWTVLGTPEAMAAGAQTLAGPAVSWARAIAAELGIDLIAGSFVQRLDGQAKTVNTSLHVGPDGEIRATYRKLHMFDADVDGDAYRESDREQAGDEVVLTTTGHGARRLGMSICYDLRFPELYRALVGRGAEILTVPAAFTLATTRDHWEPLLRARAIEDQCFVLAANQIGEYMPGYRCGGRSMIVDPWGVVLATAGDKPSVAVAELDFARLAEVRRQVPALANRRGAELYSRPAGREYEVKR
jgi:predicted amidohydrolase